MAFTFQSNFVENIRPCHDYSGSFPTESHIAKSNNVNKQELFIMQLKESESKNFQIYVKTTIQLWQTGKLQAHTLSSSSINMILQEISIQTLDHLK